VKSWRQIKLKDICERITVGHVGSMSNEYIDEGIPFLRSQNINPYRINRNGLKFVSKQFHESLRKSALRFGDVAVVRTGYPGTACVIPKDLGEANCSDLVIITPGLELNAYFLSAVFNSRFGKDLVGGNLVGAAQQHFNVTTAKELKIFLPPKTAQDKIAAVLSAYDDLIETNKKRIEVLEKMAKELYREWFVRMRFPGYKNTKFVKGVPEGWEIRKINSIVEFQSGHAFKSINYVLDGKFGIVTISNVHDGEFIPACSDSVDSKPSNIKDHCILRQGDILMSLTGNVGRVCKVFGENLLLNQRVAKLNAIGGANNSYIYCFFRQQHVQDFCEMVATGAAQQNLSPIKFGNQTALIPSCELLDKFETLSKPLIEMSTVLRETNETIMFSRDLLLPRLISGKLSVEDLDIHFPPSMREEEAEPELAHA